MRSFSPRRHQSQKGSSSLDHLILTNSPSKLEQHIFFKLHDFIVLQFSDRVNDIPLGIFMSWQALPLLKYHPLSYWGQLPFYHVLDILLRRDLVQVFSCALIFLFTSDIYLLLGHNAFPIFIIVPNSLYFSGEQ